MNEIKITIASNATKPFTFMFSGKTVRDLKNYLAENGMNVNDKSLREGNLRVELISDETEIPRYKADGTPVENLFIMVSEPNNKIPSGCNSEKSSNKLQSCPFGVVIISSIEELMGKVSSEDLDEDHVEKTAEVEIPRPIIGIKQETKDLLEEKIDDIINNLNDVIDIISNIPTLSEIETKIKQVKSSLSDEEMQRMINDLA